MLLLLLRESTATTFCKIFGSKGVYYKWYFPLLFYAPFLWPHFYGPFIFIQKIDVLLFICIVEYTQQMEVTMRVIINASESRCLNCEATNFIEPYFNAVKCKRCGSENIVSVNGGPFIPQYGADKFYRRSKYTPLLVDRRKNNKPYPIIRDRRQS